MELIEYLKARKIPYKITDKGIFVKGCLRLNYTEVEELPENLTVKFAIFMTYSKIKKIPKSLNCNDTIHCNENQFDENTERDYFITLKNDYNIKITNQEIILRERYISANYAKQFSEDFQKAIEIQKKLQKWSY